SDCPAGRRITGGFWLALISPDSLPVQKLECPCNTVVHILISVLVRKLASIPASLRERVESQPLPLVVWKLLVTRDKTTDVGIQSALQQLDRIGRAPLAQCDQDV